MRAVRRGTDYTIEHPDKAWGFMTKANPRLDNKLYRRIFDRTMPYFSRDLRNVDRDWEKVGQFCKHLDVLENDFDQHSVWTNDFVPEMGKPTNEPITPGGVGIDLSKNKFIGGDSGSKVKASQAL